MKVLHFSGATYWGGGEHDLLELVTWLDKFGVSVAVYCTEKSPLIPEAEKNGISCYPSYNKKANILSRARNLGTILNEKEPDLLHIHTSDALATYFIGYTLGYIKTPCVYTKNILSKTSTFLSRLKYNCKGIKSIICISEAVQKSLSPHLYQKNKGKTVIIHDGTNLEEQLPPAPFDIRTHFSLPSDAYLVGNIANHTPPKDLNTLLLTADFLAHSLQKEDIYFIQIGGESKYTEALKKTYNSLGLAKNLFFMGFQPAAASFMPQFNAMLVTSKEEGLNLTIIESFKSKIPVIATRAGGIPEAVHHKETGLLADIGDYKTLAENILYLKENPAVSKELIKNAEELISHDFNTKKMAEKTYALYKELQSSSI
ncbi:MAG: glycosyltransferase family 4 protein [Bacteroidales bacterium]|nr:glycosyltransferase family 4 protein [Bacteroidales bacterium]